jgi:PAS domain S-box-containing protein
VFINFVAGSRTLRGAAALAIIAVLSVVWVVHRTVQRSQASNERVVHTQEVLTAIESVLATIVDADTTARSRVSSSDAANLTTRRQAERTVDAQISRLATLTADSPNQQARVTQLRQDAAGVLAALGAMVEATQAPRAVDPTDAEAQRARMDSARRTLQAMRAEENRLLADRVQADQAPVRRLQFVSMTLAAAASGFLAWIFWLIARNARRQRQGADTLRQANVNLEAQVDASAAELRDSHARLQSIIDSAVDGIIVIDGHGRIEAFNPGAERLFGYPEPEVVGRNVNMLMPSPYHQEHDTYLARHLATGVQKIIGTGREVTGLRRDGTTFPLHLSVGKMTAGGEQRFTGILHDLTARVRIEKQLREQTSLAKLGEMAAVIAHEVKNPLAGVRGAIQIIGTRLPTGSKDASIITEIVSRIDALNELMKDLLLFARPPQPKVALVDMGTLVTMTANLLRGDPAFEHVEVRVDGEPARARGDAELLKIVFVNLLVNAAHAMQGRGRIHVSLTSIADICQIVFADEGPGIPADVLEKIFTPFFTTKARGSGLGLPTVRRLIEAHQGTINIACPSAGGTVVTIQLPGEPLAVTM